MFAALATALQDKDGYISRNELTEALRVAGRHPTEVRGSILRDMMIDGYLRAQADVTSILKGVDIDHDEQISVCFCCDFDEVFFITIHHIIHFPINCNQTSSAKLLQLDEFARIFDTSVVNCDSEAERTAICLLLFSFIGHVSLTAAIQ